MSTAPALELDGLTKHYGSLRAVEIQLSAETLARLDEIWPGPGGEAPKAYAW